MNFQSKLFICLFILFTALQYTQCLYEIDVYRMFGYEKDS
jgi:hypothetical protein